MRTPLAILVCLLLVLGPVAADEKKPPPQPQPLTVEQVTDKVLEAFNGKDPAALKALAENDYPDPWLVADELCYRGEHDAAEALARAAPRKAVEKLPAYVASRRGTEPDQQLRTALTAMNAARARNEWQQALDLSGGAPKGLDTVVRIRVAYGRGLALRSLKRRPASATALAQLGEAAELLGWLGRASTAFHQAGVSAYYDANWKGATAAWESRLRIERALGNQAGIARTLGNIGLVQQNLGNYDEALKRYAESLEIARALDDKAGIAKTLHNIGDVQQHLESYDEALKSYAESLEIERARGNKAGIARTLGNIGTVQQHLGNYDEALGRYAESLEIERARGNKVGIARTLHNIGAAQANLGNYDEALKRYAECLELMRALGEKAGIAKTLHNTGTVQQNLGNYDEALNRYAESLEIARALGDKAGIARTLGSIGNVQQHLGDFDEALKRYAESLEIERARGNKAGIARTLGNIGAVQQQLGSYDEALERYAESLEIERALGAKAGIAVKLHNIGALQQNLGNYDEALKRYAECLELARALGEKALIAKTLVSIGLVQESLGNYDEVQAAYERALRLLDESPSRDTQVRVSWGLARLHLLQGGRVNEAARWALEGLAHVASLSEGLAEGEGAGARESFTGLFDVAYLATLAADDATRLALVMEQGRAGSLRESLGSRSALEAAVIPPDLRKALAMARQMERRALDAYRQAVARAARRTARKTWNDARAEVSRVAKRIEREAKHAARVALSDPDDLAEIQTYLGPADALIYYALTSAEGVALVVRKDKTRTVALPSSKDIEAATDALLGGDQHIDAAKVPTLRNLLVDPLELGKDVKRVFVSPMGRLGYVPFSLLFPDHEVIYVPSGTTYGLLLEEKAKHGKQILGLGNPDYRTKVDETELKIRAGNVTKLVPLPATKKEVEAIADVRFLDRRATETGLQEAVNGQDRWRAVHFACHGLVDPGRPMLSALALTADKENDGFLTALEIFRMKIPADLVVMSACETGKGRIYKTEGIVGLARAFMFAGAPRVICSLWKVDDAATQALMIKFYELWNPKDGSKGLGAAAALKKAQEYIRTHPDHPKWKHPYYWAAWVLWGLPE